MIALYATHDFKAENMDVPVPPRKKRRGPYGKIQETSNADKLDNVTVNEDVVRVNNLGVGKSEDVNLVTLCDKDVESQSCIESAMSDEEDNINISVDVSLETYKYKP